MVGVLTTGSGPHAGDTDSPRNGLDPALESQVAPRLTFQVPLPELPAGLELERVDTRPGTVVLSGRAAAVRVAA